MYMIPALYIHMYNINSYMNEFHHVTQGEEKKWEACTALVHHVYLMVRISVVMPLNWPQI